MTIYLTPTVTAEQIADMEVFDAFRYGEELVASRYPRHAARVLQRVVDAEPANAAGWELYGRAHFAAAHLTAAETAFRRLVELEPASGWAHRALGLVLERQSRHREGAVHHRLAEAFGAGSGGHPRVELVDQPLG